MLNRAAKRFYTDTSIETATGGFCVSLDERVVKTPNGGALVLPSARLAEVIAAEWDAQVDLIKPLTMPMMGLACTAIDKVRPNREDIIDTITGYGANDLLCYRAEGPDDLVARQAKTWQPLLDWAYGTYGARLECTEGIVHINQSDEAVAKLRIATDRHDDFELTALAELTQLSGSLVIGLAVSGGHIEWGQAFDAAEVDDIWQKERWGEDEEAKKRIESLSRDIEMAARYLSLLRE